MSDAERNVPVRVGTIQLIELGVFESVQPSLVLRDVKKTYAC